MNETSLLLIFRMKLQLKDSVHQTCHRWWVPLLHVPYDTALSISQVPLSFCFAHLSMTAFLLQQLGVFLQFHCCLSVQLLLSLPTSSEAVHGELYTVALFHAAPNEWCHNTHKINDRFLFDIHVLVWAYELDIIVCNWCFRRLEKTSPVKLNADVLCKVWQSKDLSQTKVSLRSTVNLVITRPSNSINNVCCIPFSLWILQNSPIVSCSLLNVVFS